MANGRGYRNPEFFAKMVEHLEIDQYGTSFAPEVGGNLGGDSKPDCVLTVMLPRSLTGAADLLILPCLDLNACRASQQCRLRRLRTLPLLLQPA